MNWRKVNGFVVSGGLAEITKESRPIDSNIRTTAQQVNCFHTTLIHFDADHGLTVTIEFSPPYGFVTKRADIGSSCQNPSTTNLYSYVAGLSMRVAVHLPSWAFVNIVHVESQPLNEPARNTR